MLCLPVCVQHRHASWPQRGAADVGCPGTGVTLMRPHIHVENLTRILCSSQCLSYEPAPRLPGSPAPLCSFLFLWRFIFVVWCHQRMNLSFSAIFICGCFPSPFLSLLKKTYFRGSEAGLIQLLLTADVFASAHQLSLIPNCDILLGCWYCLSIH